MQNNLRDEGSPISSKKTWYNRYTSLFVIPIVVHLKTLCQSTAEVFKASIGSTVASRGEYLFETVDDESSNDDSTLRP
jgi:hypothetical protein